MGRRRSSNTRRRVLKKRRLYLAVGVAVGVLALCGGVYAVQLNRQAPNLLRLARTAVDEREYATATRMFEQYLEFRPSDADVYSELAGVYDVYARAVIARPVEAVRHWDAATTAYESALAFDPARTDDRRELAKLYVGLHKYSDARKHVNILLNSPALKSDPELYELLAACEQLNHAQAAELLRKAIDTGAARPDTYLRLAYLLKRDVNTPTAHSEADEVMRRLVTKDRPNDVQARIARARYYAGTGRRSEAETDIRHAYEKLPGGADHVDVILAHADTLVEADLAAARTVLESGTAKHPDEPLLALRLAEIEARSGNPAPAVRILNALAEKLTDTDPLLFETADRLLDVRGDRSAAVIGRIAASPKLKPLVAYLEGRIALANGNWPEAIPLLTQAVPAISASQVVTRKQNLLLKAHLSLAECYGRANDPAKQAEAYQQAVSVDGSSVPARLGLASAYAKLNRPNDATNLLNGIAAQSPDARVGLARQKLAEALRQPANNPRRFDGFWEVVGRTGPYPPDVLPVVAIAHTAAGDTARAAELLEAAVKDRPTSQAFVMLAGLKTGRGDGEALAVLDAAERAIGPTADVLLARALLLARDPAANAKTIVALAGKPVPAADRFRLLTGLGELLLAVGKGEDGIGLLQEAAKDRKFDLGVRLTIFDWAVGHKDTRLQDDVLREIRQLEGDDGVYGRVAEVTRDMRTLPLTPDRIKDLSARLRAVQARRENWSRIPYLLGVLAREDGRNDEALELFQTAIAQGERSDPLVREVVRMLMQRERYAQAFELLGTLKASGHLSSELERRYRLLTALTSRDRTSALAWVRSPEAVGSANHLDHLLRGLILARNGQKDEADQAFTTAQNIAPNSPEVYVTRVRVMLAAGATPDSLRPLVRTAEESLTKAKSPDATVALAIGQMYDLLGDAARAAEEYQKARRANPADLDAPRRLYDLLVRSGDRASADRLLDDLRRTGRPDVVRWANRTKAYRLMEAVDWHKNLSAAVELLDANLTDGHRVEDVRAKAFVLAHDPFRRQGAIDTLRDSLSRGPLSPDDGFRLAQIHLQAGRPEQAEQTLSDATRGGTLADPAHLAALAQLQVARNDLTAARNTVDTLRTLAAGEPVTVIEEARLLARADRAAAAKRLLALPSNGSEELRVRTVGRLLESFGCGDQAKELYTSHANGPADRGTSHAPLVEFLVRTERAAEAVKLALDRQSAEPNCPPRLTAGLLLAAVRSNPTPLVPEAGRADWGKMVDRVEQFVAGQCDRNPSSAEWLTIRGELADLRGQPADAIMWYTRALGSNPGQLRPRILNNLAGLKALTSRDGSAECLQMVNEAIGELGPLPYLLDTRALVLMAGERYEQAIADLEAAAGVSASPVYHFHLAVCHDKLNAPSARDQAVARATQLGLAKRQLHPSEWSMFDRLMAN